MHYLITGGAGFIGSNIAHELTGKHKVTVLDDFSSGKMENLETIKDSITIIKGTITDLDTVRKAVEDVDVILHQAAIPSVPRSISNPLHSHNANINGTLNLFIAAKDEGVKKVVFASSSSVYGESPSLPKHEGMPLKPISPYGLNKQVAEDYARLFYELYGLKYIALRYFNVFGPRQDPASKYSAAIPLFIKSIMADKSPVVFGDGEQTRDFTYVANVVDANLKAAVSDAVGVFNIAAGERISVNAMIQDINSILGKNINPTYTEVRKGDILHSFASIEAAKQAFGYAPSINFKEGMAKTIAWYR